MAAISLHALQLPQLKLFVHQHAPVDQLLQCKKMKKTKKTSTVRKISAIYGHDYEGKMVDENMVILRKRIHDMKIEETPLESQASRWMEWEKQYYSIYCSDVCEAVALLQRFLMDCRPALGLGIGFLLLLTMFVPVWMIGAQLIDLANKGVAAVLHI